MTFPITGQGRGASIRHQGSLPRNLTFQVVMGLYLKALGKNPANQEFYTCPNCLFKIER
jgi:hypothetical protein